MVFIASANCALTSASRSAKYAIRAAWDASPQGPSRNSLTRCMSNGTLCLRDVVWCPCVQKPPCMVCGRSTCDYCYKRRCKVLLGLWSDVDASPVKGQLAPSKSAPKTAKPRVTLQFARQQLCVDTCAFTYQGIGTRPHYERHLKSLGHVFDMLRFEKKKNALKVKTQKRFGTSAFAATCQLF